MATTEGCMLHQGSQGTRFEPSKVKTIKALSELPDLKSIPWSYVHHIEPTASLSENSIPVIDFSLLTSSDPDLQSIALQELSSACEEWGFFLVVNHGVPETLQKTLIDGCDEFFNLKEEEKLEFEGKHVLDSIRCGTSFNTSKEKAFYWRDYLKVFVHPEFHFPNKPKGFSEVAAEYCQRIRQVVKELLKGISRNLGLEDCHIEKTLNMNSTVQVFIANLYPSCPQPELAMGMPSHSDHGLLTLLVENGVGGLQIQHNGKWINVNALPNSFLVNTGDHLEILSNGRYKSVLHRVIVNNKATRISLAIANGPSLDTLVEPTAELVDSENNPAKYSPLTYKEFLEMQQSNQLDGKSCLDRVRIRNVAN